MATFRKGAEAIQAAVSRSGGGKFTPTHRFDAGTTTYLQFLTGVDDIYTVLMHRFIIVGQKENGDPKYADFISRRDPSLDGAEGYDALIDRFDQQPSQRSIGVALEVEPIFEKEGTRKVLKGFEPVMRQYKDSEEVEHEVPNIALVIESPYTFFGHLTAFADAGIAIEDVVFAVKRTGTSTDTQYTFIQAGDALTDIDEMVEEFVNTFDLDAWLEGLADEDLMHELIDPLPDDAKVSKYPSKKKKGAKKDSSSSSGSRSTRSRGTSAREAVEEPAEEETAPEPEAEEEESPAPRKRSFAQLREDAKKKKNDE